MRPPTGWRRARRAPGVLAAALMLVAACAGTPPTATPEGDHSAPAGTAAGASSPGAAAPADLGSYGLSQPLTVAQMAAVEDRLAAGIVARTGIETVLGVGGWAWVQDTLTDVLNGARPGTVTAGVSRLVASTSADLPMTALGSGAGLGLGLAAGIMTQVMANPSGPLSNLDAPFDTTHEQTANGERTVAHMSGRLASSVTGSRISATVDIGIDVSVFDATTGQLKDTVTFRSTGTVDLDLCPDPNGIVRGHVSLHLDGGTGAAGQSSMGIEADVVGTVFNDAYLHNVDVDGSTTEATTDAAGAARGSTVSAGFSTPVAQNGSFDPNGISGHGQVDSETGEPLTSDEVTARYGRIGSAAGFAIYLLGQEAQKHWRGGACVEIHSTETGRDVRPNERVQFSATPYHKVERRDLRKPIVAEFTGEKSADPLDTPIPAPALFDFVAASLKDRTGTFTLTSTSNRGIGKLDVTFRVHVGGWAIDQPSGGGRITGRKCGGQTGDWTVKGTYEQLGMKGKQRWTFTIGANGRTGTYTYVQTSQGRPGGSPVTVFTEGRAEGTVTLAIEPDGSATMDTQEASHTYRSWTAVGGKGRAQPVPLEQGTLHWDLDPTC
jgi:hypothetical protein